MLELGRCSTRVSAPFAEGPPQLTWGLKKGLKRHNAHELRGDGAQVPGDTCMTTEKGIAIAVKVPGLAGDRNHHQPPLL